MRVVLTLRATDSSEWDPLWLTDITEHHTDEGKLSLCAIKDVYSARIVGYSIDSRMKTCIATNAWPGPRRRQRALGKLTPLEFETIYMAADAA